MCLQESHDHPLCVSALAEAEKRQNAGNASGVVEPVFTVVKCVNKRQELDLCPLKTRIHSPHAKVETVAFFPDDDLIDSAGSDSAIKMIDMLLGDVLLTMQGHAGVVTSIAI